MYRALLGLLLLGMVSAIPGQPEVKEEPKPDPVMVRLRNTINPETQAWTRGYVIERCAEHIATINQADRYRIRYFDLSAVPRQTLPAMTSALFFTANSTARIPVTQTPRVVPNTDNRIFWIDLAWFNWSVETWESISKEEPFTVEPIVPSPSPGLTFLKKETKANPVIRGDWFVYYAMDNGEFVNGVGTETFNPNSFYYQLLYSNVEFDRDVVEKKTEQITEYREVKKQVTRTVPRQVLQNNGFGRYSYVTQNITETVEETVQEPVLKAKVSEVKTRKKVKGVAPNDTTELEKAWFVDFDQLKEFPIDKGVMVDKGFSAVAINNRILWRVRTKIGVYWRTYDVFRTAGDQDFIQNPFPKEFNAGEHIIQDERGAQFYHLSDGKGKSVDFANPFVVKGDPANVHNSVLVTSRSCVHCHDNGIIGWRNEHQKLKEEGVDLKAGSYALAERFNQFFLQEQKMKRLLAGDQDNYAAFIREATGLTPQENVQNFIKARTQYIQDVTLDQAARELGVSTETFSQALAFGPGTLEHPAGVTKGRLGRLILNGHPVPRHTWERGLYQEAGLLLLEAQKGGRIQIPK